MHMMQVSSIIRILLRRYWYLTMCAASIARDLGAESPKTTSPAAPNVVRWQHHVLSRPGHPSAPIYCSLGGRGATNRKVLRGNFLKRTRTSSLWVRVQSSPCPYIADKVLLGLADREIGLWCVDCRCTETLSGELVGRDAIFV